MIDVDLRVTQRSVAQRSTANLQQNLSRLQDIQEQLSSGRRLQRASDAPADAVTALRLRSELRRGDQLVRNADDGLGWLARADGAMSDGLSLLSRARELALRGSNGSLGDADRNAIATEVDALREQLLGVANSSYLGRPLFGGTTAGAAAYDAAGSYVGDAGAVERTLLPGQSVQVNVTGPEAFGPAGAEVFAVLADVSLHLRTDPSALAGDLAALDDGMTRLTTARSQVGARYNQVEVLRDRVEVQGLDGRSALAEVESVDLAEASMELALQEVAYQAALAATARALQPSLLDFLR